MIADRPARAAPHIAAGIEFAQQQQEYHLLTAESYDGWAGGMRGRGARRLVELLEPRSGEQVLDVGCGTGLVAAELAAAVSPQGRVVGIDVSEAMLRLARRREAPALSCLSMAAEHLDFPDATFDAVTFGQSLPYLADPAAALAEALRVLRPGGRVGICCQRRSLSTPAQVAFFSSLGRLARRHPMRVPRPTEDRAVFGEPRVLRVILHQAGFRGCERHQTVIGGRAPDARSWVELMAGAGPYPHALISVLGPSARARFEAEVETLMGDLEEEAFRLHHALTFAIARRPGEPARRDS